MDIHNLRKKLQAPFSESEEIIARRLNNIAAKVEEDFYTRLYNLQENERADIQNLLQRPKRTGDEKRDKKHDADEFGYYISPNISSIYITIQRLGIKSLLDLGAGVGVILAAMNQLKGINWCEGVENEQCLIDVAFPNANVRKGDVLKLTEEDVTKYDCLYFWDPIKNTQMAEQFADNIRNIIRKDQYIIAKQWLYMLPAILDRHNFDFIECYSHYVLKLSDNVEEKTKIKTKEVS